TVVGVVRIDSDHLALRFRGKDGFLGDARVAPPVRGQRFDLPRRDLAVAVLHIQMNEGVRVEPLDLRDHALQNDLLVDIEHPADLDDRGSCHTTIDRLRNRMQPPRARKHYERLKTSSATEWR